MNTIEQMREQERSEGYKDTNKKGYINLYIYSSGTLYVGHTIHDTKEAARKLKNVKGYVQTIEILLPIIKKED